MSALLNVKAFNLFAKVHQNGASTDARLVSSTLQEPVHLVFMLHACSEWPCTQGSVFMSCLAEFSSRVSPHVCVH